MSFLKKLFGGGGDDTGGGDRVLESAEHKGFTIRAIEMRAGSEYQLCGEIEKQVGEEAKVHRFIRADRLSSVEQAASAALDKARQIVDEQGEGLFH